MEIHGIGIDTEEIHRFKAKPYSKNKNFYEKIFSKKEIEYCLKKSKPYLHFTGKFCGKEAIIKASKKTILNLKNIEILNSKNGEPYVKINNKKEQNILVSISHNNSIAAAFSIIHKNE